MALLFRGEVSEFFLETRAETASAVASKVEELLEQASLKSGVGEISRPLSASGIFSGIILGSGPGSFTGLRVAFTFAKAFCLTLKIPLLLRSTLEAYICEASLASGKEQEAVVAILDARGEEYFAACGYYRQGIYSAIHAPQIISKEILNQWVSGARLSSSEDYSQLAGEIRVPFTRCLSVGKSLLLLEGQGILQARYSVATIVAAQPLYIRAISAKTLAERGVLNDGSR